MKVLSLLPITTLLFATISAQTIDSLSLIQTSTNQAISTLSDGDTIDLTAVGSSLSIRANATNVGSVVFQLSGSAAHTQTESVAPYALFGDSSGSFTAWSPAPQAGQNFSLTATPYSESSGSGTAGTPVVINFSFTASNDEPGTGNGDVFLESNGLVVIEAESIDVVQPWQFESSTSGFLGDGYLRATANASAGGSGTMVYPFRITNGGNYQLAMRSIIGQGTNTTEHNDSFVRLVDAGGNPVTPISNSNTPTGTWYKAYMNSASEWIHMASNRDHAPRSLAWALQANTEYALELSVRSEHHLVDRLTLWNRNGTSYGNTTDGKTIGFDSALDALPVSELAAGATEADYTYQALSDFPVIDAGTVPYYEDTTYNALAIDASIVGFRDQFARAELTFDGASANYDITIQTMTESDGESTYRLLINGTVIDTYQNPRVGSEGDLMPNLHTWESVALENGDTLAIESNSHTNGLIPEGNGTAWARGRWTTLFLDEVPSSAAANTPIEGVYGDLQVWHRIMVAFEGPQTSETATPNPFRDYRLDVTFTGPSNQTYSVPGYYAADGNAGETSATSGNIWRVNFTPDEPGQWTYAASFVQGTDIAAELTGGDSAGFFDGATGSFTVTDSDKTGRDHRGKGKLSYVGEHFLQFEGSGDYFIKSGANSPEVFLEYTDFDNTPSSRNYASHVQDRNSGDPTWQGGKGHGIIGVINYLSELGSNTYYFLLMNSFGDGRAAWPFLAEDNIWRYDVSKLEQWEIVFEHFDRKGLMLNFVLTETENEAFFEVVENGTIGGFATSRKIYFREMIARFGHHLAITWNIGEENGWDQVGTYDAGNTDQQRRDFSDRVRALIPYNDHVTFHNGPSTTDAIFTELLGHTSLTGPALQWNLGSNIYDRVLHWRTESANAGHPWVVSLDEPYVFGTATGNINTWRREVVWATFMAGGAGVELYLGGGADITVQDLRPYESHYETANRAAGFFRDHIAVTQMSPDEDFISNGWTLLDEGETYVFYLPNGGTATATLPSGQYRVQWFDPRNGGALQNGSLTTVNGGDSVNFGSAPSNTGNDWVVLVERIESHAILFIRSGSGRAGFFECGGANTEGINVSCKDEQASSINNSQTFNGNHGWNELAMLLESDGFILEEIQEGPWNSPTPVDLANMDLEQYSVIVFGSNNNVTYTQSDIDAVEAYVRAGGGVLFISDANFGWNWGAASTSDQLFMDRFGLVMNQDQGTYSLQRNSHFTLAGLTHPILNGVNEFDGEGVTPITVADTIPAGVSIEILATARNSVKKNNAPNFGSGSVEPVTANDAALVVATVDSGRVAGHFDRNTFFNSNGAGTNINRFDNATYALNLFRWLAGVSIQDAPIVETNLALQATISDFSGQQNSTNNVENTIDGITNDLDDRWGVQTFPQYVEIDLGSDQLIGRTVVYTYDNRDYQFVVESRTTSGSYETLIDRSENTQAGPIEDTFTPVSARFVKFTFDGAATYTSNWVSILEIEIYSAEPQSMGYELWSQSIDWGNIPLNQREAESDASDNGLENIIAFAFNFDPTSHSFTYAQPNSTEGLPNFTYVEHEQQNHLCLEFPRRKQAGISYEVRFGSTPDQLTEPAIENVQSLNSDWEWVEARDPQPTNTVRFGQITVTEE